jgi:hypothetical protein
MDPFEFYSQVYGLDSVIMPVTAAPPQARPITAPWLVFTSSLSPDEFQTHSEMFYKITAAMGLKEHEFSLQLQNATLQIQPSTQVLVSFGGTQVGWNNAGGSVLKNLTVPSLEDMARHPELKKTAWTLLKQTLDFRRAF